MNRRQWLLAAIWAVLGVAGFVAVSATITQQPAEVSRGAIVRKGVTPQSITSPEQVLPIVTFSHGYEAGANRYYFEFLVGNGATAQSGIEIFGIRSVPDAYAFRCPAQWAGLYGYDGDDSAFVWVLIDTLTMPPPNWTDNLYPSPYAIDPGDTLHRFVFYTDQPPAVFRWYAQGFDSVPGMSDTPRDLFTHSVSGQLTIGPVDVKLEDVPKVIDFGHPRPNPARGALSMAYSLPSAATVRIGVYDVAGRLVRTLDETQRGPGVHTVMWDGKDAGGLQVKPGAYFTRLYVNGKEIGARRVTIVK